MKPIRDIDPAVWIGLFFSILIAANITFFAIALSQPDDRLLPHELGVATSLDQK